MTAPTQQRVLTPRVMGAVLAMVWSAVALVGCSLTSDTGSKPADRTPPVVSPEDSRNSTPNLAKSSDCVVVPAGVLAAVDRILLDPGDSVPFAASWYDEEANLWIIVGDLAGPSGAGEGIRGTWGTKSDIASAPFDGDLLALDSNAALVSTAQLWDIYVLERQPMLEAVHKCFPAVRNEADK